MAEHLHKDPKTYQEEYISFIKELKTFHDNRGTSFSRLPRLNGQEVDLYLLYNLVTTHGGWEKVNINGDWESLLPYFGIHRLCANGTIALKQIYIRYLDVYERVHFLGEEVDRRESELHEEDDARNRRKALRLLHATPVSYNAAQHLIPDNLRGTAGFSTDIIQTTPTERLFLSLLCPLPNEQDFAINVCSLLAMENRKPFQLQQCPRIVDALVAHAGVFSQVDLRHLYTEYYKKIRGQNVNRFWHDVIPDTDILQLIEEDLVVREDDVASVRSYWSNRPGSSARSACDETKNEITDPISSRKESLSSKFINAKEYTQFTKPYDKLETTDATRVNASSAGHTVPSRGYLDSRTDDERLHEFPPVSEMCSEQMSITEEDSQCSIEPYKSALNVQTSHGSDSNVTASLMRIESVSHCEPSFKNCLTKTLNTGNENPLTVTADLAIAFPKCGNLQNCADQVVDGNYNSESGCKNLQEEAQCDNKSEKVESENRVAASNLVSSVDDASTTICSGETTVKYEHELQRNGTESLCLVDNPVDLPCEKLDTAETDIMESASQIEANPEKKNPAPKFKLPTANIKPDNPRAVRYWLAQKRAVVQKAKEELTEVVESHKDENDMDIQHDDLNIFHLGRDLGVHDPYGQRVLQVLNIIRNLSFDDVNSAVLAGNEACVRLLLLGAHAKWSNLPQLALDALSNIASEVKLADPADCSLSAILLGTVTRGLESSDRFIILRCLEALSKLSQRDENESLLISSLDSHVYELLCSYLTIPDVALLIYTLECVHALSSLGQSTCNAFLHCPGMMDILISLLTIEAQSYGSKARILMQVVETVAEGDVQATSQSQLNPTHCIPRPLHSNSPTPSTPSTPPPVSLQPVAAPAIPVTPVTKIQPKPNTNSRPSTPTSSKPIPTTLSNAEKEQMAMQWLRTTFELVVGAPSIEQNSLYKQYAAACTRTAPRQVLGTVQFYSCVRATFGQNVGPFRKQVGTGVEFYFEGLSPRSSSTTTASVTCVSSTITSMTSSQVVSTNTSTTTTITEIPGSPILKAQLCAPPKPSRKETSKQSLAYPHLSQALGQTTNQPPESVAGNSSNTTGNPSSSLIKSLLANKVPEMSHVNHVTPVGLSPTATALPGMNRVPCMNVHANYVATTTVVSNSNSSQEVTQRQQQQKLLQQQQETNGPTKSVPQTIKTVKTSRATNTPKVNGVCSEAESSQDTAHAVPDSGDNKSCTKGMLADLLEREVKREPVNGATLIGKELRISDKGLELVSKGTDNKAIAVDMGVVGMDLGVDLGDGGAAPKAAHLIAQIDDSGHVQIHLEEEPDSSSALCNGQSLLDQLEACEVTSSTDPIVSKGIKRPAEETEELKAPATKKTMISQPSPKSSEPSGGNILEKAIEMTLTDETPEVVLNNGQTNGIVTTSAPPTSNPALQPVILAPNAPRTFLILQPQTPRLVLAPQGQRLLLAIPRPGGGVQHIAMPPNMMAISSSQLQTNGGVLTFTNAGNVAVTSGTVLTPTVNVTTIQTSGSLTISNVNMVSNPTNGVATLSMNNISPVTTSNINSVTSSAITTMAASSGVATSSSIEGVVTFSGGAVAFPARPTEISTRNSNLAENHVTITPVSAAVVNPGSVLPTSSSVVTPAPPAPKKRNNSTDGPKPRARQVKTKPNEGQSTAPLSSQSDTVFQYMCEWKDCMRTFKTPHEVYIHACHTHCPAHLDEIGCSWERCDGLKRKRFSMMTHLMDRHCNDEMQKLLALRRYQMNTQGKTDIPAPQTPTPHPGYAPHAALQAIKRHAVELMNQKEQEEKEGPVTKSIRLTSALILRNIATHSSLGRRCLRRFESHLASVALSNVESSRTVSQILFELTHQGS